MKRQRGRNRRPGGGGGGGGGGGHQHHNNNPNRTLESNGPDTKVRGPAAHIYERYLQLARDAASSGDRVLSENYMQHADHYFRMVRQMQPAQPVQQPQQDRFNDGEAEGEEGAPDMERAEGEASASEGDEQPDVEFPQGQQPQQFDREGGGGRRRGRRNRFRPGGEGEASEGGEERRERAPREARDGEERRERAPRAEGEEDRGERRRERNDDRDNAGPEGFSHGPKPAFLRSSGE